VTEPDRGCPAVYAPVRRELVVDRFGGSDALPLVRVNGVSARLE
jgi:hypothetical protein